MNAAVEGLDELGVAKAIRDGELTSPQRYQNILLVALRITGTGAAYRQGADEFVWRAPSLYLNDEFLERCQGLPVILEHPQKNILNSQEFTDRIIGTVMLPYVKGDEIWAVSKIYDMPAARMLETEKLSTSPAVVLGGADDSTFKLSDGKTLLIEGKPVLLDHLAVTALGTWDRGGPPAGVESIHADSSATQELRMSLEAEILDLKRRMPAPMDAATREIVARDVGRYEALAQAFGDSAAPPYLLSGETLLGFRARLASKFKHHSPMYKDSNLFSIGDKTAMEFVTRSIYDSAEKAAHAPTGPLRSVTSFENGHRVTRFYGNPAECWGPFMGAVKFGRINLNAGKK